MHVCRTALSGLLILVLTALATAQTRPTTQPTTAQLQATIAAQQKQITDLQVQVDRLKAQLATASQPRPATATKPAAAQSADARAEEALQQRIAEITCEAQGLEKVLNFLRDNTGVNIFINWKDLEAVGVDRNTPITASLKNVPLEQVLTTLLAQASQTAKIDYAVDNGVVTIARRETLAVQTSSTRTYDVRKLITGSGTAQTAAAQNLINTMEQTCVPDSWRDMGGTIGSVRFLNGNLIVTQDYRGQKAVAALLAQLTSGH